jgi:hypothetical protein
MFRMIENKKAASPLLVSQPETDMAVRGKAQARVSGAIGACKTGIVPMPLTGSAFQGKFADMGRKLAYQLFTGDESHEG